MQRSERVILHLDMDAFYAAVEIRHNPSLAGLPVIIGHRGRRGVVSTCSYEARKFGVRSAMPSVTAERLCPLATWLPGRMELYVAVSRRIRGILCEASPRVEPISIDEAFIDLTGIAPDLAAGAEQGRAIKAKIREAEGLSASVGVAPNKFLAKLASDLEKPDGLVVLPLEVVPTRLWPLTVSRLWGVGPKTAQRLESGGLRTIGDIARASRSVLEAIVGRAGAEHLAELAQGRDPRAVDPTREAKSISEERTYAEDLTDRTEIDRALLARSSGVGRQLRREGLVARTVHIKVRSGDFTTWTRAHTLPTPTDLDETIVGAARELFRERIDLRGQGVRLLGVGVSGIEPAGNVPPVLFTDADETRARNLARASDAVRNRLGEDAVVRASLLRKRKKDDAEASSLPAVE